MAEGASGGWFGSVTSTIRKPFGIFGSSSSPQNKKSVPAQNTSPRKTSGRAPSRGSSFGQFWRSQPSKVPGNPIKQIRGASFPPRSTSSRSETGTPVEPSPQDESQSPRRTPGLYTTPAQERIGHQTSLSTSSLDSTSSKPSTPRNTQNAPSKYTKRMRRRVRRTQRLLEEPNMNIQEMRGISWSGLPISVRAVVWRILLGYLPSNKQRRAPTLTKRRQEYKRYVAQHFSETSNIDEKALLQIRKDVPRLWQEMELFRHPKVQESVERILYVWAIRHPASGYVQGIDDLSVPFFVVFLLNSIQADDQKLYQELPPIITEAFRTLNLPEHADSLVLSYLMSSYLPPDKELEYLINTVDIDAITPEQLHTTEADTFSCMTQLMKGIQDHYINSQPGIQKMVHKLSDIVKRIDGALHNHIQTQGLVFLQFAFRWMNNLLMRELPLTLCIRLWDTYISEESEGGFKTFHVYVCAALIMRWEKELKAMEFQDLVMFLQHLPTQDWAMDDIESLISQAFVYKSLFAGSSRHLQ